MKKEIVFSSACGLYAGLAVLGCASAKVKQQQAQIKQLEIHGEELTGRLKDKDEKISTLETAKIDLDSKVEELNNKLSAAQAQIDSLEKSNKDLSHAMESNKSELVAKVKELVADKDKLAEQLNQVQKTKASLQGWRDRNLEKLSRLQQERDKLSAELDKIKTVQAAQGKAHSERLAKTREEMEDLADAILKEIQGNQATIDQDSAQIVVTLQEALLFSPNQSKLTEGGTAVLDRLGAVLHSLPARLIHIQGHTDNAPIKWELFGRFTSHWDLSAAQATSVARYLHEHAGLDPTKLVAEGYGEFRPLNPNDSAQGRSANRRIILIVEPQ